MVSRREGGGRGRSDVSGMEMRVWSRPNGGRVQEKGEVEEEEREEGKRGREEERSLREVHGKLSGVDAANRVADKDERR